MRPLSRGSTYSVGEMTERLYYTDSYCARFEAVITDVVPGSAPRVYLDRTAFYPTSGGQPHDSGSLNGVRVSDVVDEGERIAHVVQGEVRSGAVTGVIDWQRRYDHMQQHTGQHVISALFADSLGARTLSVHFGADAATVDIDVASIADGALRDVERRANEIAWENRHVSVTFENAEAVAGLRKAPERAGELRVVSIDGLDRSACGGTHVRGTSEIAPILFRRSERVKKAVRVEFLCGGRALARATADYAMLTRLAQGLSTSVDEVAAVVTAQSASLREADTARRRLAETLAGYRARELYDSTPADSLGVRRALQPLPRGSQLDEVRALALAFATLTRGVFIATTDEPPALLVAAADDSGVDAGDLVRRALTPLGGRGGGSPRLAQGTVPTINALEAVVRGIIPDARLQPREYRSPNNT
jgi:alanyl-tRNA synthetase